MQRSVCVCVCVRVCVCVCVRVCVCVVCVCVVVSHPSAPRSLLGHRVRDPAGLFSSFKLNWHLWSLVIRVSHTTMRAASAPRDRPCLLCGRSQASELRLRLREAAYMQIDGEPWHQPAATVHVRAFGQSSVLRPSANQERT